MDRQVFELEIDRESEEETQGAKDETDQQKFMAVHAAHEEDGMKIRQVSNWLRRRLPDCAKGRSAEKCQSTKKDGSG